MIAELTLAGNTQVVLDGDPIEFVETEIRRQLESS
jgi:hypothetical protein